MAKHARRGLLLLLASVVALTGCGGGGRPNYGAQTTPPSLAWASAPPAYTISPSLTLNVTATDTTMGVSGVFALVGGTKTAAAQQEDGSWQATITLPVTGHNIVTVWAEDKASPVPNSGQGKDDPYQLTADVIYSPTPPGLSYDGTFVSYADERALELVTDANGVAKMPAEYRVGPKVPIVIGGDVYKAVTRLAGGSMTAAELESTNAGNIPVMRFAVVHNPNTDPPLQGASYVAQVTCPGCPSTADATGLLFASTFTDATHAYFDLPLSTETIPALAGITSTALVSVTVTVTSSAGTVTTAPGFNVNFHLVGPPLAIVEDAQYAAAANPNSTYAYRVSDGTYAKMWDATWWRNNQASSPNEVRLLRYLVTNPTAIQVAIQASYAQSSGGSWRAAETRTWSSSAEPNVTWTMDGMAFSNAVRKGGGGTAGCATEGANIPDCVSVNGMSFFHQNGTSAAYQCAQAFPSDVLSGGSYSGTNSTADVGLQTFRIATELGGQERGANQDATGRWTLVPAASGGVPGTLIVYVTRPVAAARSIPADNSVWGYDAWVFQGFVGSRECRYQSYAATRFSSGLTAAQESLYGTLTASTASFTDGSGVVGDSVQRLNVVLSRSSFAVH